MALRVEQVCGTNHDAVASGFALFHPAPAKKRPIGLNLYQTWERAASPLSVVNRSIAGIPFKPFTLARAWLVPGPHALIRRSAATALKG